MSGLHTIEETTFKPNAIVVCCSPSWLPLAACTLISCVEQGGADVADLYVIALEATPEQQSEFEKFIRGKRFEVNFISASLSAELLSVPVERFSPAALLRLTLDRFIPSHHQRLLYLDCDILAQSPIAPIFAEKLAGSCVAAVEDFESLPGPLTYFHDHPRAIGLPLHARYFNSGVLLFDWPKTLAERRLQHCVEKILQMVRDGNKLRLPDQDVLNQVFSDSWHRLPITYNLMAFFVDYFPQRAVFRHFSSRHKPWNAVYVPGFAAPRNYYANLLAGSAWRSFVAKRFTHFSISETLGCYVRALDIISRRRYQKHLG